MFSLMRSSLRKLIDLRGSLCIYLVVFYFVYILSFIFGEDIVSHAWAIIILSLENRLGGSLFIPGVLRA